MKELTTTTTAIVSIIDKAMTNPDVDIEKMTAILDMQERIMDKNAEIEFNKSMVSAISEIPSFEKATSGHNYKYATFEQINKVVKPILASHNLYVTFLTDFQSDNYVMVTAEITHKDGFSKKTSMRFPFDCTGSKNEVQAVASAISYGKRYMQNALLNITTHGEDDDGFASERTIGEHEIARLNNGLEMATVTLGEFCDSMGVAKLSEIKVDNFNEALHFLNSIINARKPKAKELSHANQ
jgi:hypothetical protein